MIDTTWQESAACADKDPAIFDRVRHRSRAKLVCAGCPVLERCREWCDEQERFETAIHAMSSVFAGETPRDRARRRLAMQAAEAVA